MPMTKTGDWYDILVHEMHIGNEEYWSEKSKTIKGV